MFGLVPVADEHRGNLLDTPDPLRGFVGKTVIARKHGACTPLAHPGSCENGRAVLPHAPQAGEEILIERMPGILVATVFHPRRGYGTQRRIIKSRSA